MTVTRDTLDELFGRTNISMWADLDNEKNAYDINERVTKAIARAQDDLVTRTNQRPITTYIAQAAVEEVIATLAGIRLYNNRGLAPLDGAKTPVDHRVKYVNAWIADWLSGTINFTAPKAPFIICDHESSSNSSS